MADRYNSRRITNRGQQATRRNNDQDFAYDPNYDRSNYDSSYDQKNNQANNRDANLDYGSRSRRSWNAHRSYRDNRVFRGSAAYNPDLYRDVHPDSPREYASDYLNEKYYQGPIKQNASRWSFPGPYTGVGPNSYRRPDESIKEDINERLTQHGRINARDIDVDVNNGEVTLKGTVHSRGEKRMAEDIADAVSGVSEVHNEIKVA